MNEVPSRLARRLGLFDSVTIGLGAMIGAGVFAVFGPASEAAGAGLLVILATLQADPAKASGLDSAVKTLGQAPFGKILLILAALGIAAFGAYSFVRSKHGRM